jgi:hypothetical protein
MLSSLKRFVLDRLGAAPREDLAALKKAVQRNEHHVVEEVAHSSRQLAKRLDRLERRMMDLIDRADGLDAVARSGRLRKIDDNVDALVRHTFLNGNLTGRQALLARRFRGLSQHEEDGLTVALFDRIGAVTHRFVEIGAGVNGGNSGFLARECGWTGLMIEAHPERAATLRRRFAPDVSVVSSMVTRENVNTIIDTHGYHGDVDLLSIDVDGIDYWVWENLTACRPRLVIVEYNPFLGADRSVAIPYDPQFDRHSVEVPRDAYYGASLPAFAKLGAGKGYRLVLVEPRGVNAFFVRDDVAGDLAPMRIDEATIAPEAVADFGPGGIFEHLEQAGLALVDV